MTIKTRKINKEHEDRMVELIKANTSYEVKREHRFHETRRWRFDAAITEIKTAFEMEGGTWTGKGHIHPLGFEKDLEKYNTAALMGWTVYRFVPRMLNQGWIENILKENNNK
jgi:hypothetical protein